MSGRSLTEKEAAEVWCPWAIGLTLARDPNQNGKADYKTANRARDGGLFPAGCHCLGGGCAAWVWIETGLGACGLVPGGRGAP
jgi:hypothetical protein